MSVLIKGMKMPKSCFECVCKHKFFSDMRCYEFPDFIFDGDEKFPHMEDRSHYCPLIPVSPHGDLIDRDDIRKQIPSEELASRFAIENAYVVIPAEKSEGGEEDENKNHGD